MHPPLSPLEKKTPENYSHALTIRSSIASPKKLRPLFP